jgi:transposase (fragment)
LYGVNGDTLRRLYKYKLSGYTQWEGMRKTRYGEVAYVAYPQNCGPYLSIDETALSKDELFTIVTNKDAHGGPGTLVAMLYGAKSDAIISVLEEAIPLWRRLKVKEVTCDLSSAMMEAVRVSFPSCYIVNDRFHVQQLFNEAMDELRIDIRHEVRRREADAQEMCREAGVEFVPMKYRNGETLPQILLRTKRALMVSEDRWTPSQRVRMGILFDNYPIMQQAYDVMQNLRCIFNEKTDHIKAGMKLMNWFNDVAALGRESFNTVIRTFKNNYRTILNYFRRRSTNASAESFNAKIKMFRAQLRGVSDPLFFIFRLTKLFA